MDCSSITAPAKFSRRFGRDYKQLDSLTQASLYCRDLGKVKVDCRLRVSQSKWGVLGGSHTPAATLYMDFTFLQPPGCRLSDATITVTLQPVETASGKEGVSCTKQCLAESSASNHLQMTDYYGPKHLCGEPVSRSATKTCRFTPHISAFDSGVGGVGVDSEESVMHTSRWTFTGALLPAVVDRNSTEPAAYRTLRWELAENELDLQPKHVNTIQTGFTLEHNGSDFYMVIAVQGKLLRKSDRLKGRLGRLRFPRENEGTSVTKINPGSSVPLESRLDPIAHGLSREMERRNLVETPVQIPEALSATFCDASSIPHGGTFGDYQGCTQATRISGTRG
ncbi:hypothetical protein BDV25DRAFT_172788 [Aspergillus avenaceus]|uniref:Uncharacterized protein n=1 Tax=Aspergillus avenaceus TaxID=36643 RepID=A0A5N6TSY9_ASPAV|nr:hypothetical protein BDV25DRAFT_172788 [Aspergillus avenaceus]